MLSVPFPKNDCFDGKGGGLAIVWVQVSIPGVMFPENNSSIHDVKPLAMKGQTYILHPYLSALIKIK